MVWMVNARESVEFSVRLYRARERNSEGRIIERRVGKGGWANIELCRENQKTILTS